MDLFRTLDLKGIDENENAMFVRSFLCGSRAFFNISPANIASDSIPWTMDYQSRLLRSRGSLGPKFKIRVKSV